MTFEDIQCEVELHLTDYDTLRCKLASSIREHDLLELQTRLNIESLKKYYEEEGLKSTQAKYKAESEEQVKLRELIELEHTINLLKAKRDKLEFEFQYLFREYDRLQFEEMEE